MFPFKMQTEIYLLSKFFQKPILYILKDFTKVYKNNIVARCFKPQLSFYCAKDNIIYKMVNTTTMPQKQESGGSIPPRSLPFGVRGVIVSAKNPSRGGFFTSHVRVILII